MKDIIRLNKSQIKKIITKTNCCIVYLINDKYFVCDIDYTEDTFFMTFKLKAKRGA